MTPPATGTTNYVYDDAGRLVATLGPDPDGAGPRGRATTDYAYDDLGRLWTETGPAPASG